jgi:uncharacterized protein (TIGR02246 family)
MEALDTILDSFADAFNRKDARALAALFTEDGDLVNILGVRMRGRAGVEAGHAAHFGKALAGNVLRFTERTARTPRPGVVVAHAQWQRDRLPDAPEGSLPPGSGIFTLLLLETERGWKIDGAQNTQHGALPR